VERSDSENSICKGVVPSVRLFKAGQYLTE